MTALVISLDFEMFWGVTDSKTIENYGPNVAAEWDVVPRVLQLFKQYDIHATWATVGMLACKDYKQWSELRPSIMPTYKRASCSNYTKSDLVLKHPELFFARPMVHQVLETQGQELASHTHSHFFCGEEGVNALQFAADLECAQQIFDELDVKPTSIVFPRNQVRDEYLDVLSEKGFKAYRGNPDHWLYRHGHLVSVPFYPVWRLVKAADACLPLTGHHSYQLTAGRPQNELLNVPASRFLRPVSGQAMIDALHSRLIKNAMLEAAQNNKVFHLWWHPHNFGSNTEANLSRLENLLKYFTKLKHDYGMVSLTMKELEEKCRVK